MLLINGNNTFDIFVTLVYILKVKCFELFGERMIISSSTFEKDTEPLKEFFASLGIVIFFDISNTVKNRTRENTCFLKDYQLWVSLSSDKHLLIRFDYEKHQSTPCHLE